MPSIERTDHRGSADLALLRAFGAGDALAFAEACTRTVTAAHAVARRFVPAADVEPVLRSVYARLWTSPPASGPLAAWVRAECFQAAVRLLRARGQAPVAPSAHLAAPDLAEPGGDFLDAAERALAALDPGDRLALVRAHDMGLRARTAGDAAAATRALLVLADAPAAEVHEPLAADWVLGLLPDEEAGTVVARIGGADGELARALRRGRRRLEGLPPAVDLVARLVAATVAAPVGAAPARAPERPPARVAPEGQPVTRAVAHERRPAPALATPAGQGTPAGTATGSAVTGVHIDLDPDDRALSVEPVANGGEDPGVTPHERPHEEAGGEAGGEAGVEGHGGEPDPWYEPAGAESWGDEGNLMWSGGSAGDFDWRQGDDPGSASAPAVDDAGWHAPGRVPRRRRPWGVRLAFAFAWVVATAAAVGVGMLIGRVLLDSGLLP